MQAVTGLLDDTEDLVPRRDLLALDPGLGVRAAQRDPAHAQQHFAGRRLGARHLAERDAAFAMEIRGLHR